MYNICVCICLYSPTRVPGAAAMGSCHLGSPRHNLAIVHNVQLAQGWNASPQ